MNSQKELAGFGEKHGMKSISKLYNIKGRKCVYMYPFLVIVM